MVQVSFTQGMQSLTDALASDLSTSLRLNHTVTGLDFRAPTGCNVVFTDASGMLIPHATCKAGVCLRSVLRQR